VSAFFNVLVAGLLLGGTYALVAVGLNLVFGVVRVINFAHGELVMLGMYGAYAASQLGLDPYLSIVIVAPLMFILGLLIQRLLIQPIQAEPMMQVFVTCCSRTWYSPPPAARRTAWRWAATAIQFRHWGRPSVCRAWSYW
jgi:branched-subunit amino acid ABC-type transport system permease component